MTAALYSIDTATLIRIARNPAVELSVAGIIALTLGFFAACQI